MRLFSISIVSILVSYSASTQDLRHYDYLSANRTDLTIDTLNHSSLRNLYFFTQSRYSATSASLRPPQPSSKWYDRLYDKVFRENFIIIDKPGYRITADPLFDAELGRETIGRNNTWVNTRGGQVYGKIDLGEKVEVVEMVEKAGAKRRSRYSGIEEVEKVYKVYQVEGDKDTLCPRALVPLCPSLEFYTSYYESQTRFPGYMDSLASISGGVPGQGAILLNNGIWDHGYATGWVRYNARKYFTFEFGTGKNFFGNGYRSMLLSDNARNYPYFRIDTRIWRFHYTNLWAEFQDNQYHDGPMGAYQKKYGAFHYLSYSITNRLELSVFEAIIWQGRDSLHTRGFDINYLNPIIFLRPVEWTLGSPDNALFGGNLSYRFLDQSYLYGQLLLDDFPISHIKAQDGYWGNKIAGQAGFRSWIPLGSGEIKEKGERRKEKDIVHALVPSGVFVQSEFNFARPYTYSHWTTKQNYGHIGQPIAHPLGANFYEWVNFTRLHWNHFIIEGRYSLAKFGGNYDGLNYGQDIFIPNTNYVSELDNYIGQGRATTLQYTSATVSFLLNPSSLLNVFCTVTDRKEVTDSWNKHSLWFTFGVRNSIRNFYYDY